MGFQHPPEGDTISPGEGRMVELLLVPAVVEECHELVLEGQRWKYESPRESKRHLQRDDMPRWRKTLPGHAEESGFLP